MAFCAACGCKFEHTRVSVIQVLVAMQICLRSAFLMVMMPSLMVAQASRLQGLDTPVDAPPIVSSFAQFLLPKTIQDVYHLSEFISTGEFAALRVTHGDVQAVDAIYNKALRLSWGNHYAALLIALLSTLEHRRIDVRIPLLGIVVPLPLTPEFEDEFHRRVDGLPKKLYPDSPEGGSGDRDKLQHFFGSALVTYVFEAAETADRLGLFVEWGEEKYVEGETEDQRDIRTNREGQRFALALLDGDPVWPSQFIGSGISVHQDVLLKQEPK